MNYRIRTATRDELDIAIEWAAREGWNPGLHDADSFYRADPEGFFFGLAGGEPIATISAVRYGETFGFVGFYIVRPEYRGNGFGLQIWNEALAHLPVQNIGLDGVLAQQENYRKSGFKFAHRNIRYQGAGSSPEEGEADVVALSDIPFEQLRSYDRHVFPADRLEFLRSWIRQPDSLAIGSMRDGQLNGCGVVRKCRTGFKIGPLFADSETVADVLFRKMSGFAGAGAPLFLDVPETNVEAVALAKRYRMTPMFETARMYTKAPPAVAFHKVFGITTFELG